MALFGFGAPKRTSVALIDIDSSSIGGAVAYFTPSMPPAIAYSERIELEPHQDEHLDAVMLRTLKEMTQLLVKRGGPALRKASGSGHIDHIFVRIGTPWQQTLIRREKILEPKPFIFTYAIQHDILRKKDVPPDGYQNLDETVIATLLNGYPTAKPFGKQTRQIEMVIASSWIEKGVAPEIQKVIRGVYHTHALTITTPASMSYGVFKQLFAHEKNYLILEISEEATNMSYVKDGALIKAESLALGVNDIVRHARDGMPADRQPRASIIDIASNAAFASSVEAAQDSWVKKMESLFQSFASEQALPRTIFLIAPEGTRDYLTRLLDTPTLRSLWLSDEPLRVVGVAPSHLGTFVSIGPEAQQDTVLGLFALYARTTIHTPLPKG